MGHEERLDVGEDALRTDRVEVALEELAIAASLRVLAPPNEPDVVALEGCPETSDVLRREASERHGEVEPHGDVPAAIVLEPIRLLVCLGAALAEQDLGVLERRRVDRGEAVAAEHANRSRDQRLACNRSCRQEVAEAFEGPGLNEGGVGHGVAVLGGGSNKVAGCQRTAALSGTPPSVAQFDRQLGRGATPSSCRRCGRLLVS